MEEKKKAIDELIQHLSKKIDIDDDMNEIFDEFHSNMKETDQKILKVAGRASKTSKKSDEPTKKRGPTLYNLYVKDMSSLMKENHPEILSNKRIAFIAAEWKTDPMAEFIRNTVAEMKKEDKDGDIIVFYAKAKTMYTELETKKSPVKKTKPTSKPESDKDSDKDNKLKPKPKPESDKDSDKDNKLKLKPKPKSDNDSDKDNKLKLKPKPKSDNDSDKDKKKPAKKLTKKASEDSHDN